MDPVIAFLDSTKEFDTVALARSTQKAIELIMPWCQMEHSSTAVAISQEINLQVQVYARAIDSSLEAANMGFTIAEEAISLVELIKETTPAERREFLEGIKVFTAQGYAKAVEARKGFVEVGTTVNNLLKKMKVDNEEEAKVEYTEIAANGFLNKIKRPFTEVKSELAKGIHDLEEFGDMLSKFAAWWNEMAMETASQLQREQKVSDDLDKADRLRIRAIEQKWKNHKMRYAAYVNEIGIVQDRYPKLLKAPALPAPPGPNPETHTTTRSNDDWAKYPGSAAPPRHDSISYPSPLGPYTPYTSHNADARPGQNYPGYPGVPPYRMETPPPPPAYGERPTPLRTCSAVLSHEISTSSYISASLAAVQILEKNKCLLILEFQCHTSSGRRFDHMTLKWNFRPVHGSHPPLVLQVAPRQSIGARNEENHHRKYGVTVPVQFTMAGATAGPEASAEIQIKQKVERAMIITGSIRGRRQDSAEWSIEENTSVMSGIPSHFCVATVIQYTGPFIMELEVLAKQRSMVMMGWSRRAWHSVRIKEETHIDADTLQHQYEPYKPSSNWKEWFPLISGEVQGFNNVHPQEALRRG